jgi:hypothetical protein
LPTVSALFASLSGHAFSEHAAWLRALTIEFAAFLAVTKLFRALTALFREFPLLLALSKVLGSVFLLCTPPTFSAPSLGFLAAELSAMVVLLLVQV